MRSRFQEIKSNTVFKSMTLGSGPHFDLDSDTSGMASAGYLIFSELSAFLQNLIGLLWELSELTSESCPGNDCLF